MVNNFSHKLPQIKILLASLPNCEGGKRKLQRRNKQKASTLISSESMALSNSTLSTRLHPSPLFSTLQPFPPMRTRRESDYLLKNPPMRTRQRDRASIFYRTIQCEHDNEIERLSSNELVVYHFSGGGGESTLDPCPQWFKSASNRNAGFLDTRPLTC